MTALFVAAAASAAATQSLELFLRQLVLRDDMAVVVALQNREALDEERFRRVLSEADRAPSPVRDGAPIEPGHIYLSSPNALVTVENGTFRVRDSQEEPGERGTIDSLLVSVAKAEEGHSIAVLFAGMGGDGTLGVTAVKEAGGVTLAEATADLAEHDLAASNLPSAIADFLVPAAELAGTVDRHAQTFAEQRRKLETSEESDLSATLSAVATVLRNKTGHDFHGYKRGTFLRRIQRRMQVVQMPDPAEYLEFLRADGEEAQSLFNDLLIGVTQFFRDRKEFEFLEANVVPRLFEGKARADQLRVWVIGCSTGEEAYSLAILLREHMATLDEVPQVQIFATDLDGRALASARVGRYPETIARDLSPERLARWFVKEGATYCVAKEIREMCIFSQHSVIKDAPFSRLDLVSCRNLLIYLDADLQSRVIPLFHFALKPDGYLFLGNSENVSRHTNLFAPVESRLRIFQRLSTGVRVLPDFPFTPIDRRLVSPPAQNRARPPEGNVARGAERIAERYAPAYVVTDTSLNVLHFSGRTGRYIDPAGGAATLNLLNLVHPDLRLDLRVALSRALEENETVQVSDLRMGVNGHRVSVDVVIEPVSEGPASAHFLVVLFKEVPVPPEPAASDNANGSQLKDQRVQQLERELRTTNERLQATVEELESTNEELKSSNEEYQSLNEELQSANEELETSKEELQSVNEELTTVNGELAHRVQELGRANSDLKNLLESTQIATVFLDNQLRVMNYTPAVTELFHLVETDLGRPISHIKSRIAYEELQDDVRRVLRTLGSVDREIASSTTGNRYIVRVLPYRSVDNFIGGAVITFTNTTPLTRAQEALRDSEKRLRLLMEGIPQLVWRSGDNGHWTWSSPQWMRFTGQTEAQSLGLGWLDAVHPEDRDRFLEAWSRAGEKGALDVEHRVLRASDGAWVWHHSRSMPVRSEPTPDDPEGRILEWLGTTTDVQELKQLQESQAVLVTELQHRTRNLIGVVRSLSDRTLKSSESMDDFKVRFNDRLAALSRVQGLLSRSEQEPITIGALVQLELDALGAEIDGDRVKVEGPDVVLRSRIVQTFALALHELATNARKYGALSGPRGRLAVLWRTEQADGAGTLLRLEWLESGITHGSALRDGDGAEMIGGYGRELIEKALPYSLGAETGFQFSETGLTCTINLPLSGLRGEQRDEP
ncbi:CheR family methyltransferase [Jiella sp. M17.18]|uniref:CheR family methyltransferase n=1 Tax=Jiella sp. M17.18 TaxID=3234247 RepID=UPI0034DE565B